MNTRADDVRAIEQLGETRDTIVSELRKVIVGMDGVIDEMMIAIFLRGHCLRVGVPGLAKTLLVSSLGQDDVAIVQADSVYARPDAIGHHGHQAPAGGPTDA